MGRHSASRLTKSTREAPMTKLMFKSAALALAVPGLALAVPAAAAPAAHSAAYSNSAVWGDQSVQHHKRGHGNYDRYGNGYQQQAYYGEPVYANTQVWEGNDGRYYCRKSNGTTGLVIGAAG